MQHKKSKTNYVANVANHRPLIKTQQVRQFGRTSRLVKDCRSFGNFEHESNEIDQKELGNWQHEYVLNEWNAQSSQHAHYARAEFEQRQAMLNSINEPTKLMIVVCCCCYCFRSGLEKELRFIWFCGLIAACLNIISDAVNLGSPLALLLEIAVYPRMIGIAAKIFGILGSQTDRWNPSYIQISFWLEIAFTLSSRTVGVLSAGDDPYHYDADGDKTNFLRNVLMLTGIVATGTTIYWLYCIDQYYHIILKGTTPLKR